MTHYLKAESKAHLYQSLVDAGVLIQTTDHLGEQVYNLANKDIRIDEIGPINTIKHDLDLDSNGDVQFETTTECVKPAQQETRWEDESELGIGLPEGVSVGDLKTSAVEAEYHTHTSDKPKLKQFMIRLEDHDHDTPEMMHVRMIMPGDVNQPAVETIELPALSATYWQDEDMPLPEGVQIGDEKTPATEAVYKIETPATYHDLEASLSSPVAYHANISGITGAQAAKLPTIDPPSKPTRVWWS